MIAYTTGQIYDRGILIGHIKAFKVIGKRHLQWGYIPQGRINPTIVCRSKEEIEDKLGCRSQSDDHVQRS